MTLTLPIEIGKKYVRRDGKVVRAQPGGVGLCQGIAYVGDGSPSDADQNVWLNSGLVALYAKDGTSGFDLAADYIEPAKPIGHPHWQRMAEYAEDAKVNAEPWKLWQFRCGDDAWTTCMKSPEWAVSHEYRRKPKIMTLDGFAIPNESILAARAEIEALFAKEDAAK